MKKKALSILLSLTLILSMMPCFATSAWADTEDASNGTSTAENNGAAVVTGKTGTEEPILAYVPLDNRTVNVDRVIYEAESAGFKVMMPDPDLYATRLDGQPLNSNGTQYGDGEKLLNWLMEMDKKTDYFVISLDQILSGGLVNSRTLCDTNYRKEYKMIDKILELSQNNHVYIIDTVARLASCTVGYQGATQDTYNYLRQYNITPRKVMKEKFLTVDSIVSGYERDENDRIILVDKRYGKEVDNSLLTRKRKLSLIDYILTNDTTGKTKYFIGIDDSNSQNTIQTNEINYIRQKMGGRGLIYSGADELGMMAVLSLMIDHYGYSVKASAAYFGETEASSAGSAYDIETVRENVDNHLKSIGVHLVDKDKADLDIVVLTSPSKNILNSKYITKMIDYINNNISQGIPTIVINSAPSAYSGNLEYRMVRECEMSMLLSYSSWGTVGNSIGLAFCNGISRYLYLHSRTDSSDKADIAFLKGLIFSFEKDISYIRGGGKDLFNTYITSKGWSTSNFYQSGAQVETVNRELERLLKNSDYNVTVNDIIDNLTDCRYLKGLGGECGIIGKIRLSNYSAPFFRTYEIRFDIGVDLKRATVNGNKNPVTINLPYTPAKDQLTYAVTLYYLDENGKMQKLPCTYDRTTGTIKFAAGLPGFFMDTLSMEAGKAQTLFSDVAENSWYFNDIMYAYEKGLMHGVTSSTFEPNSLMTRAMLVQTLYSMSGSPAVNAEAELPGDVGDTWYSSAVKWAVSNNIVSGYGDGRFGPKDAVTREQLACILWKYAGYKGIDISDGPEPGISNYADQFAVSEKLKQGFEWACTQGIITGAKDGTLLLPQKSATRAEVAAVLRRFMDL